jgi:hypothetical protein
MKLVPEYESNRDKLPDWTSSGRWNPLHGLTRTLQVFTPCNEIQGQLPMSRSAAFCCAYDAFIRCNPCHQALDPFAAVDISFCSNPVCMRVSGSNFRASPKEAFRAAFQERLYKLSGNNHD